jgi:hypothetical protein
MTDTHVSMPGGAVHPRAESYSWQQLALKLSLWYAGLRSRPRTGLCSR